MIKYLVKVFRGDDLFIQMTVSSDVLFEIVDHYKDVGTVKAFILDEDKDVR